MTILNLCLMAVVILIQIGLVLQVMALQRAQRSSDSGVLRASCENLERGLARLEAQFRDDMAASRAEGGSQAKAAREELSGAVKDLGERLDRGQENASKTQTARLLEFAERLEVVRGVVEKQLGNFNESNTKQWESKRLTDAAELKGTRAELHQALEALANSVTKNVNGMAEAQRVNFEGMTARVEKLTEGTEKRLSEMREMVDARLKALQEANTLKLEEMRVTVDEKLQGTLEKRLGESFTLVSERLEQVHKGLGEMQTLANGVGDLKKVLTNVKTRGTWGEIQLGSLLEQMLSPQQFARNVMVVPGRNEMVEFAIRLPGRDEGQPQLWLPIDAKYPSEDYERLMAAQDAADVVGVETAGKQLEAQIKKCAREIAEKYIAPPHTTDFAILFLPTEGLYAEIIRRTDIVQILQRDFRVTIAGPTTLAAILNSLQMGFRTLAIEKRSSEVWTVLGQAKTEFGKYGDVLDKVRKKLGEAQSAVDQASVRTRAIDRSLREVEALPVAELQPGAGPTLTLELPPANDELLVTFDE